MDNGKVRDQKGNRVAGDREKRVDSPAKWGFVPTNNGCKTADRTTCRLKKPGRGTTVAVKVRWKINGIYIVLMGSLVTSMHYSPCEGVEKWPLPRRGSGFDEGGRNSKGNRNWLDVTLSRIGDA